MLLPEDGVATLCERFPELEVWLARVGSGSTPGATLHFPARS
jgi:hypothetical protein